MTTDIASALSDLSLNDNKQENQEKIFNITLVSNDDEPYIISSKAIKASKTISNLVECIGESDEPIPLPNVDSISLKKLIMYMKHYEDDMSRVYCKDDDVTLNDYDINLIGSDESQLVDLINACNYLNVRSLQLCCYKVIAELMTGKTPEEIRDLLKPNDMTDDEINEELEELKREYKWLVEL